MTSPPTFGHPFTSRREFFLPRSNASSWIILRVPRTMQRKLFTVSVAYLITLAETSFSISIILCCRGGRGVDGMSRVREQFVIRRERFNVSVALTSVFLLVACLPKVSLDTACRLGCTHTRRDRRTCIDTHKAILSRCYVGATLTARSHMLAGHFREET